METLVNFRDVGGIPTKKGTQVTPGKIFRSGEIVALSEEDKKRFTQHYQIKTIFDLRGEDELKERPDDLLLGTTYINLDIMKDSQGNTTSFEDMQSKVGFSDEAMKQLYQDMLLTKSGQQGYTSLLEEVASKDDPFIFHCFAGKDRTGIAAALILSLLDVELEAIYRDYLLTNVMRQKANQLILADLRKKKLNAVQLKEVETMMTVKPEYLEVAFTLLNEEFGGVLNYVKDVLGLPTSLVKDMKKLYTY